MLPTPTDFLFQVAMQAEAQPLISHFNLQHAGRLAPHTHAELFTGTAHGRSIAIVTHGRDPDFHCDRLGTETATLVAHLALVACRPSLLVSAGACGGFHAQGGAIGDLYMPTRFFFHDQRIAIPHFEQFGVGDCTVIDHPESRAAIGAKHGTCSTGSSLDATASEMALFARERVTCKDMEAAAIVRVARDHSTAFMALKVVTDLVDDHEPVERAFARNLSKALERLVVGVDCFTAIHQTNNAR